jgi:hypothetical protein
MSINTSKLRLFGLLLFIAFTNAAFPQSVPISSVPGLSDALFPLSACSGKTGLGCAIPNLYGAHGLALPNPNFTAHFMSSDISNFSALNTAIATQLTLLPLASPASGFTYQYDPGLGIYARSSESLGPVLTERGETIGRHKIYFGGNFQRFRFNKLDGVPLHNFPSVFTQSASTVPAGAQAEGAQFVSSQNSVDLKLNQFTLFGTFGLTSRIDLSVAIPFLQVGFNVNSVATINRIANTEPIVTPGGVGQPDAISCCSSGGPGPYGPVYANYFDPANKAGSLTRTFSNNQYASDILTNGAKTGNLYWDPSKNNAAGIGDVTFRIKGSVYKSDRMAISLLSDVRLPTGDETNFLGSGAWGIKPFAAASIRMGWLTPHVNLGYQWNGSSLLGGNIWTGSKAELPGFAFYSVGTDLGLSRRLTFAVDYMGQELINAPRLTTATYTSLGPLATTGQTGVFPTIASSVNATYNQSNAALGLKYNFFDRLLVSCNLLVALNDGGLRERVTPLIGLSYAF